MAPIGRIVARYPNIRVIETNLDPLQDVLTNLEFLTAEDYVTELLRSTHGVARKAAAERARLIRPHVRTGIDFVRQALAAPEAIAFLPAYYGILNLAKVQVLFGGHHAALAAQRWHGVSYGGHQKNSHSLLTEKITLHPKGAIPLLYATITGERVRAKTGIQMRDLYPFISEIGHEWHVCTGKQGSLAHLRVSYQVDKKRGVRLLADVQPSSGVTSRSVRSLQVLDGMSKISGRRYASSWKSKKSRSTPQVVRQLELRHIRPFLVYHGSLPETAMTPVSGRQLLLPEELVIALAFFHLGSVVRYKPEFLDKLQNSRYWPMAATLRKHALYKYLLLFWSAVNRTSLFVKRV